MKNNINSPLVLLEDNLIYFLSYCVSIFIFFQIPIKFQGIYFVLNLADIFALAGLSLSILKIFIQKEKIDYVIPYTNLFWILSVGAMAFALMVGWIKFGSNHWAFFVKFTGWFVIIGYALLASFFIKTFGAKGAHNLIKVMSFTLCTVILIKFLLFYLVKYNVFTYYHPSNFHGQYWSGFSLNRNSFAFQVLIVLALLIFHTNKIRLFYKNFPILILSWGIYLSSSRSGQIGWGLLLILSCILRAYNLKSLFYLGLSLLFLISLPPSISYVCNILECSKSFNHDEIIIPLGSSYADPTSNIERIYTIIEGLKIWIENPILGGGLGSFIELEHALHNKFLVIHNTIVWLLAEFGLVGSSIFFIYGFSILKHIYNEINTRYKSPTLLQEKGLLISIIFLFILFSQVHEILYQRLFWFVFGLSIVKRKTSKTF